MKDSKLILGLVFVILIAGLILGYKIFIQDGSKLGIKKVETELLNNITNEVKEKTKNEQTTMTEEEKQKLQQQLELLDKYEKYK